MGKPYGIILLGANGSGKSTLGRELARALNFAYFDVEDYWFYKTDIPYTAIRSQVERSEMLLSDIKKHDSFVVSGDISGWGDEFLTMFDLAVFLSAPVEIRMKRIENRENLRWGDRICEGGDMFESQQKFMEFAAARDVGLLEQRALKYSCSVIQIDGTQDLHETIRLITQQYSTSREMEITIRIAVEKDAVALNRLNTVFNGVGGKMITALCKKYEMAIEAETDDDAVDFYRKRGFSAVAIRKYGVRRWTCVLAPPKPLDEETDKERQARIYPIIVSEYNPAWPEWYTEEKINLERLIGTESIARISHYGSTSVPGLTAKPTVDILLEITEDTHVRKLIDVLSSPEYICLNPPDMPTPPPHLMFLKGYSSDGFSEKVYHIHVRYPGDWDELYFRDYLITHPKTTAEYAALKTRLHKGFEHDRNGYTDAKTAFIREVTGKARKL